ncbi:MAG: M10 family metallopeptidase C-terminal domain-containing protein, partial [Methylococcaceae bacterium]
MTILHELGHALGLEHPVPYNAGDVGLFLTENANTKYSVIVKYDAKFGGWWTPSKPMLYDILAIQTLYGVNTTDPVVNNTGDKAYKFKTGADAIQAIWDNGGTDDTIDAHEQSDTVTIDLRPGHFSFVGKNESTSQQQIAIAYQVKDQENNWIENAIGGSGADKLTGNDANNKLTGGADNDTLEGGQGNDTLEGGQDFDTYVYHTGDGNDEINDEDHLGKLIVNDHLLVARHSKDDPANVFKTTDGDTLSLVQNALTITLHNSGGTIKVLNFDNLDRISKNLGI